MKPINWRTGQNGQLEFAAQLGNPGRNEPQNEQVDPAGSNRVSAGATRSDSWVDATVTLLATIVFGLGWAVVELEGADPMQAGYDQASQTSQAVQVAVGFRIGETWGAEREPWIDVAPRSSKQ